MGDLVQGGFPSHGAANLPSVLPWDRERRLWWLLWGRCPGIGSARLAHIEAEFGSLEAAWKAPLERYADRLGWYPELVREVDGFRRSWGPAPLPRLQHLPRWDLRVLLPGDRRWPQGIGLLARPPQALYWKGRGSLWAPLERRRAVAVVGTRRPSLHGLSMARSLGAALARAGWPVVSGLAEGIDGAVHEGCLEHGGAPVGVLGTPLERVYPRHHASLQRRVGCRGLLVSELPPGTPVQAGHFASRNRLQVALATALVVVECPESSGALHSAELAWRQELPLWVVPADAGKVSAAGSNRLLARGATPLLTPADLIEQLGPGPLPAAGRALAPERQAPSLSRPPGGQAGEQALLAAVGSGASLEQLSQALGRSPAELATQLLDLELAGLLQAEPGLCWRPC
jgi:DNA processing protein